MKALRVAGILAIASCAGPPEPSGPADESADPEPIVVTRWSPRTELFMEYPPLRAGQTSRFAVHLTDLSTFEPLRDGQVGVQLDHGGGAVERFLANGPSRPGIFGVDVIPKRTGSPLMAVTRRARAIEDFHDLGKASVAGPDEHFILDRLPGEGDVFAAAGFSGHGFKFCSMVGRLMAEFCLEATPSWDIGRFRLARQRTEAW